RGAGAPGHLQKRQRPPARLDEKPPASNRRRAESQEEMNNKRTLLWVDPFTARTILFSIIFCYAAHPQNEWLHGSIIPAEFPRVKAK
ncbi:MAG: hypothetical protein JWR26_2889, partial [Pedosphaera sp.]|nr:hypothetical protein [Pedosphaera sp.]